ncbi:MAG: diaminohydroxyphosphoribosylaminopyrimidine deaminase, partial [Gammaproteobacteria bacterium]|nr:diaminohydroxyphosphoribosylaminopyrimidine deaminase [Gammaproteobacteria bacterium]
TALANGQSKWITADAARQDVQRLRAQSSSIMTGIGTVLADDPALTVRDIDTGNRQPLRVVLDPDLKMPTTAKMLKEPGRTLLFTLSGNKKKKTALTGAGAEVFTLDAKDRQAMVQPVMTHLAGHEEVNEVLVEAGAVLNGSLLCAGLIDELIIYMAPHILGHDARGLFNIPVIEEMNNRFELKFTDVRMIGQDIRITLKPVSTKHV